VVVRDYIKRRVRLALVAFVALFTLSFSCRRAMSR
jgi:hypothetical protein